MQKNILMPPALEEKLKAIDLEVRNLHFKWKFFSQLFTDPNKVAILNATAASLFQSIEDSMLSDMLLSITRLTDPPKSFRQENLSFENLIQELPNDSLRTEVVNLLRACLKIPERGCVVLDQPQHVLNFGSAEKLAECCGWSATQPRSFFRQALSKIKEKTKDIKTWRDKKLSHNDLQKALGSFSLPPIQKKDLTDTLELIPRIMNLIHRHFNDTTVMYADCITTNDGGALLFYLEYALDVWEEDKLNHNMDRLHKLQKQWAANKAKGLAD